MQQHNIMIQSKTSQQIAAEIYAAAINDRLTESEHEFHYSDCEELNDDITYGLIND